MGFSWTEPMKEAEQAYTAVSQPVDQRIIPAVNEKNVAHEAKVAARRTVPVREPVVCYTTLWRTATYTGAKEFCWLRRGSADYDHFMNDLTRMPTTIPVPTCCFLDSLRLLVRICAYGSACTGEDECS